MLRSRWNARAFLDGTCQSHTKHSRKVCPYFVKLVSFYAAQGFRLFQPTARLGRQRLSTEFVGLEEAGQFPAPREASELLNSDEFQKFITKQRRIDAFIEVCQAHVVVSGIC